MASEAEPLERRLLNWLTETGCRLEYKAAQAFSEVNLDVAIGQYVSSGDGQPREVDVVARETVERNTCDFGVQVVCECKYSSDKPWLLLTSGIDVDAHDIWLSLPQSSFVRSQHHRLDNLRRLRGCSHFSTGRQYGHRLIQAFTGKSDTAYDAVRKAIASARDTVSEGASAQKPCHWVVLPCLVLDAPLYRVEYVPERRDLRIESVDHGRLMWTSQTSRTSVDVVRIDAIDQYARLARETCNSIITMLEPIFVSA